MLKILWICERNAQGGRFWNYQSSIVCLLIGALGVHITVIWSTLCHSNACDVSAILGMPLLCVGWQCYTENFWDWFGLLQLEVSTFGRPFWWLLRTPYRSWWRRCNRHHLWKMHQHLFRMIISKQRYSLCKLLLTTYSSNVISLHLNDHVLTVLVISQSGCGL